MVQIDIKIVLVRELVVAVQVLRDPDKHVEEESKKRENAVNKEGTLTHPSGVKLNKYGYELTEKPKTVNRYAQDPKYAPQSKDGTKTYKQQKHRNGPQKHGNMKPRIHSASILTFMEDFLNLF